KPTAPGRFSGLVNHYVLSSCYSAKPVLYGISPLIATSGTCQNALYPYNCSVLILEDLMKASIHPNYVEAVVKCACGETFRTRSTKPEIHLEICSKCHPFFTGKQKLIDTAGRVERFQRKYKRTT